MRVSLIISLVLMGSVHAALDDTPLSVLGRHTLDCPVCKQAFTALIVTQSNTRGGVDRDLFARAIGPEPEYYRISTCPKCGYSGYLSDFAPEIVLAPDLRERILKEPGLKLPEGFTPESDPRELDAADRYRLAIQCYQWAQRSDEALAWLNLRASWIARDEGSVLPRDPLLARVMTHIERWRPDMEKTDNQHDVEMQLVTRTLEALATGQFNRYQRPYVELAVALILRRHGENRQAAPMLDKLAEYEAFSEPLRAGIERMRASITLERRYQSEAANCFERALLGRQIGGTNRPAACYLLGELCRRLGRDREAVEWFDRAMETKQLPPDLQKWAVEQRAWSQPERDQTR